MLMNIQFAIDTYLNWKATHRSVAPNRYEVRLRGLKEWLGPKIEIETITGDQIISYLHHMRSEESYSQATTVYASNIIRNFFEFWQGRVSLVIRPKEIIKLKGRKYYRPAVTQQDFLQMSLALTEDTFNDVAQKLVLSMLWDTGMRVSELSDLDLANLIQDQNKGFYGATITRRKTLRNNLVLWGRETNQFKSSKRDEMRHISNILTTYQK